MMICEVVSAVALHLKEEGVIALLFEGFASYQVGYSP
jgi:hypothetical protein